MINAGIGKAIRLIREAKGLSLNKVAELTEASVPYLSMIETDRKSPSLQMMQKIANALKIPVESLIMLSQSSQSSLKSSDERAAKLTAAVGRLVEAERIFRSELEDKCEA